MLHAVCVSAFFFTTILNHISMIFYFPIFMETVRFVSVCVFSQYFSIFVASRVV